MRKLHLAVGVLVVLGFLITGQFMLRHQPAMESLNETARLMYRSRHIYILASGLVNLMLGLYLERYAGWRGMTQAAGSGFLIVSPALLIRAFSVEPAAGFREEMPWSVMGLYALFAGCMLHFASAMGGMRGSKKANGS